MNGGRRGPTNEVTAVAILTSVNVGMPRDVAWHGRTVHTGVWKTPVAGPRIVRRLNIDGDGQGDLAGHGGEQRAVLVYQNDSYRYWAAELGRDDLAPGHFGENFTVDGLPDDEVCIGDRYRIGEAVFEVSQPRVTCYRVGLRLNEPRMAALLISHRRPGFYFRVLVEGEVEAGQEIVKISTGPEAMTVTEIDALLYLPGHPRDQVERALRIRALSPGWVGSMKTLLDQADGVTAPTGNPGLNVTATAPPPAWAGFRPLIVTDVSPQSETVVSLSLADPDGLSLPEWLPGQFITVRITPSQVDAPLIRSYSLCNRPGAGEYRIAVKEEPHGAASRYIREYVKGGDTMDVAASRGSFFLSRGDSPVVLLSAGVGVTPVLAMLHSLAQNEPTRPVWWIHGARNSSEHLFAAEARALLTKLPQSKSHVSYSRPTASDQLGVHYDSQGRLSADVFDILTVPHDVQAYLCGPATFMDEFRATLTAHGLDPAHIHVETFGAAAALTPGITEASKLPHLPAGPAGAGPSVDFARCGLTVAWHPRYGSLLELAEACDVPTRWSCRTGVCHSCETAVLSGSVTYDPEPVERPAGNVLICCSAPSEDLVLDL
ncbi:MAG: MOSC domain-containing protein [Mycobacteriaceae bacterium]|nr:MOSC domain-containing protein [Mycobacteriaceae bacterium]